MHVTLEQARAFDALARHGTFAKAADALKKRHTAVLYAMRSLEDQTGLVLLDRTGYRTQPTAVGARVLEHCRRLLEEESALARSCHEMKTGWEPALAVVIDGICDVRRVLQTVAALVRDGAPTRVEVEVEFLARVERVFDERRADMMISLLAPEGAARDLKSHELAPIRARLVASREHPLVAKGARPTAEDLSAHVLVSVRGSDPRLELPTAGLEPHARVRLSDFAAKKTALLEGVGFGWMPEHLVSAELRRGLLREIKRKGADRADSVHVFRPRLYVRDGKKLGRAATRFVEALTSQRSR